MGSPVRDRLSKDAPWRLYDRVKCRGGSSRLVSSGKSAHRDRPKAGPLWRSRSLASLNNLRKGSSLDPRTSFLFTTPSHPGPAYATVSRRLCARRAVRVPIAKKPARLAPPTYNTRHATRCGSRLARGAGGLFFGHDFPNMEKQVQQQQQLCGTNFCATERAPGIPVGFLPRLCIARAPTLSPCTRARCSRRARHAHCSRRARARASPRMRATNDALRLLPRSSLLPRLCLGPASASPTTSALPRPRARHARCSRRARACD